MLDNLVFENYSNLATNIFELCVIVWYRTRAIKGQNNNSKIMFSTLRLSHKDDIRYNWSWVALTLFSVALCDDHTPCPMSSAAFCHNLANFYPNSNFGIAKAWNEESSGLFKIWAIFDNNCGFYSKVRFPEIWAAKPHAK